MQETRRSQIEGAAKQTEMAGVSLAGDDALVPFAVKTLNARGRAVQLGPELDKLLKRHNYPEPIAALLAETIILTSLLGSSLKFEGKFILQSQTDGIVSMLVCDYLAPADKSKPAALRAYARFDKEKLAKAEAQGDIDQKTLLGNGTLALTIDQGAHMKLYQGIVALDNMTLEDAAHQYFEQSEQIPTKVRLATALLSSRMSDDSLHVERRGGGILVQHLPGSGLDDQNNGTEIHNSDVADNLKQTKEHSEQTEEDKWSETEAITATVEDAELTDPDLPVERLLYRLFHTQGVHVYEPQPLIEKCSCSRQKLVDILSNFSEEERKASVEEDGKIKAKCEFCSNLYEFTLDEFQQDASKTEAENADK